MAPSRFPIRPQPDDVSCGPTCLHAVYRHFGEELELDRLIAEIPTLRGGGTLGVLLGHHALGRGYRARAYTFDPRLFDPTWFDAEGIDLAAKLEEQALHKTDDRFLEASEAYVRFLQAGGELLCRDLTSGLLRRELVAGHPILTGLSSTWLHRCRREIDVGGVLVEDDVRGEPVGHFVVLLGYETHTRLVDVADPDPRSPVGSHRYRIGIDRVLSAILLGVLTYDANLLILNPRGRTRRRR